MWPVFLLGCSESPGEGDDSVLVDTALVDTADSAPAVGLAERVSNATCLAPDRPPAPGSVAFERVFSGLSFSLPVALLQPPGSDDRWFVVEQTGTIRSFANDESVTNSTVVLDIADRISAWASNEDGLLGMDFHPNFAENGDIYVAYTHEDDDGMVNRFSRFHSDDGGLSFAADQEEIILEIDDRYTNHNGGHVLFGPDGLLYLGTGDGGSGGDPKENAQNAFALLGKMLRIDVDAGSPYAIPADNPYADGLAGAPEVYAMGLRNPWRYSFDPATGQLWVGDVGQVEWEEIDIVERGGNYGWNDREGFDCYELESCEGPFLDPVFAYSHDAGDPNSGNSITGGVVYRGTAVPDLVGTYLFADAARGHVWGLSYDKNGVPAQLGLADLDGSVPASFATDKAGEVYIVDYVGALFRMGIADAAPEADFPTLLSETGCFKADNPLEPADALIPYGVNMPLWSDGAEKERWLALPDGEQLSANGDGSLNFPLGSVLAKHFRVAGTLVETRLFVQHDDGWAGYSYAWNAEGNDAVLLSGASTVEVEGQTHLFPSRGECMQCHNGLAGSALGPRIGQLDRDVEYPNGVTEAQLAAWVRIGLLEGEIPTVPAYAALGGNESEALQGRAYLATNCATCHLPGGSGGGGMDLRLETDVAAMGVCGVPPAGTDLGVEGALLLTPGNPSLSLLSLRMRSLDAWRMPPLATQVVDTTGAALVDAWISSVQGCE